MHRLTAEASAVLERMESGRRYDVEDLRAFVPHATLERVRDLMHELWVSRQVERVGQSGWQRHHSAPPHATDTVRRDARRVKPEELFDHDGFAEFFK